jgi:hypothetical protein
MRTVADPSVVAGAGAVSATFPPRPSNPRPLKQLRSSRWRDRPRCTLTCPETVAVASVDSASAYRAISPPAGDARMRFIAPRTGWSPATSRQRLRPGEPGILRPSHTGRCSIASCQFAQLMPGHFPPPMRMFGLLIASVTDSGSLMSRPVPSLAVTRLNR